MATKLLQRDEQAVAAVGEETGRLPAALRWAVERGRIRSERRRAIFSAVIGPLLFAVLTLLAEPLPALVMGTASPWSSLKSVLLLGGSAALALIGLPWLFARPTIGARARTILLRVPLFGSLVRLDAETLAAGLIARFAEPNDFALAPRAARAISGQVHVDALGSAATDPFAQVASFSEPFALALKVGVCAGDLPARLAAFHRGAAARLTARLRAIARGLAFTVVFLVALQGIRKLLATPLPGLGRDLGNSPEMRELERELENAGH